MKADVMPTEHSNHVVWHVVIGKVSGTVAPGSWIETKNHSGTGLQFFGSGAISGADRWNTPCCGDPVGLYTLLCFQ
jgi:hypothetical protein